MIRCPVRACWLSVLLLTGVAASNVRAGQSEVPEADPAVSQTPEADAAAERKEDAEEIYELQKLLVDALDQVQRNYVREVSRRELVEAAIRGILEDLDPYSNYIGRDEMKDFRTAIESEFGGIGIQIATDRGRLKVLSPLVGTPAHRAGLLAGDRIVQINGKSTSGITLEEAVDRLKGEAGTKVTLTVIHPGQSTKQKIVVTREVIHVHTVLGDHRKPDDTWDFMLDGDKPAAYIRVTAFSRNTAAELRDALGELKKENPAGLILDLRFNPGGLLSAAIEVSDLFISHGRIVSVEGRNTPQRSWDAHQDGTFEGFPMVVLVNRFSASASEIVAACLQDHQRAVIMGERTWGKGSVQNLIHMEDHQSAMKLTTAGYRRPNGKNIHRFANATDDDQWGVMPDAGYRLQLTDQQMFALMADRRRRDILRPNHSADNSGQSEQPVQKTISHSADQPGSPEPSASGGGEPAMRSNGKPTGGQEEPGFTDPQLRMALDYLAGELAKAD